MKKILPALLALIGLAGGVVAGQVLRPQEAPEAPHAAAEPEAAAKAGPCAEGCEDAAADPYALPPHDPDEVWDYLKLEKQFVVPVMRGEEVAALVVLALSLETAPGAKEAIYQREPKLRDAFLQVLFRHAHSGGFDGAYTGQAAMRDLRGSLRAAASSVLGPLVHDVLVTDIGRQEM